MSDAKFDRRLNNITPHILSLVAQIDELKGRWLAGAKLHPQILKRLKQSVLITSTGSSTRIEGARLSDEEVDELMRGISIKSWKDRDVQEVKGYFELLENMFNSWQSLRFSESLIKHFHKELLKYVEKDSHHRGEYKTIENKVQLIDKDGKVTGTLFETTPVYLTPSTMQNLVEWTKKSLKERVHHSLLTIGNFIVEFLKIHPFQDGNGRLSRIITNFLLLQAEYLFIPYVSHEKIIEKYKPNYYLSLRKSQKTFRGQKEDVTDWLNFFLGIILIQAKEAIDLLEVEQVEKLLSEKQLMVWFYFQKVREASPLQISRQTKVARSTVNQVLDKLIALNKIERIGLGRGTRYRILRR